VNQTIAKRRNLTKCGKKPIVARMDNVKRFYPVSEVAARFEVTSQTVRNWIAAGRLPSVQPTPGGRYKIPIDALARFEQESGLFPGNNLPSPKETPSGGEAGKPAKRQGHSPRSRPGDLGQDPEAGLVATRRNPLSEPVASELRRVVDAIATSIHPDAVILFGSHARGDARAESDFDLAIVAPDGVARRRVAMRAYESLAGVAGRSVAVDIVVLTPSVIAAERDLTGSIARAVAHEGVVLYGSRAALA
jgi:excisionase family DNA binding protein